MLVDQSADMPGSMSEWASRFIGEFAGSVSREVADGFSAMADTARGTVDNYEVTDETLAATIGKVLPDS